jgi:hypothetical protein
MDFVKYQNHEIKKDNEQHQREVEGLNEHKLKDQLSTLFNEKFRNKKDEKSVAST